MKIGLALSGGGVLGTAHVGVLEELKRNKIEVQQICGVSAGAIIGALYADGGIKSINNFIHDLEKCGLLGSKKIIFQLNPDKIFQQIRNSLKGNLKAEKFYDLPVSFSCVATDVVNGEMAILNSGNIVDAVMASAAYPGVFPVQKIGDKFYIDGGVTRNLPARILRNNKCNFVIGSSLYSVAKIEKSEEKETKIGRIGAAIRAFDIVQKEMAEMEMAACDFCFNPPVESFRWYNFQHYSDIRILGEEYAKKEMPKLLKELKNKKEPSFWQRLFD